MNVCLEETLTCDFPLCSLICSESSPAKAVVTPPRQPSSHNLTESGSSASNDSIPTCVDSKMLILQEVAPRHFNCVQRIFEEEFDFLPRYYEPIAMLLYLF